MSTGISIQNTDGVTQIDGQFQNLVLHSKGDVLASAGSDFFYGNGRILEVPLTASNPVIAVRPTSVHTSLGIPDGFCLPLYIHAYPDGHETIVFIFRCNFSYYVFAPYDTQPLDPFGVEVYNDSSSLCYSSALKYMKVVSVKSTPDIPVSGPDYNKIISVPEGSQYAVAMSRQGTYVTTDSDDNLFSAFFSTKAPAINSQGDLVVTTTDTYQSGYIYNLNQYVPPTSSMVKSVYMVIDVTNF